MANSDWNANSWQMPEIGSSDWYQWMGNQAGANAAANAPSPYKAPQPATYLDTVTNDSLDRSNQALGTTVGPPSQSYYGEEWLFGGPGQQGSQQGSSSPYGQGGPTQADLDKIISDAKELAARNTSQYVQGQEKQAAEAYNQPPPAPGQPGSSSWYQQQGVQAQQGAQTSAPNPYTPPAPAPGAGRIGPQPVTPGLPTPSEQPKISGGTWGSSRGWDEEIPYVAPGGGRTGPQPVQSGPPTTVTPPTGPTRENPGSWFANQPEVLTAGTWQNKAAEDAVAKANQEAAASEKNLQSLTTGGTPSAQMALLNAGKLANDPTIPGQAEVVAPEVNARLSQSTLSGGLYSDLQKSGTLGTLTSGGPGMSTVKQGLTGLESVASRTSPGQEAAAASIGGLQGVAQNGRGRRALDTAQNIYNAPLASERNYTNLANTANQLSALDQFYQQSGGNLMGSGAVGEASGDVSGKINSANALADAYRRQQATLYGPGYTQNMASGYTPESGYTESLYTGGGGAAGLDQYYNNLINRGSRNLSEAAAARGGFNTGASLRSIEELNRDLSAQQAKDYVDLASKADASRELSRRFGLDLAQSGDKTALEKAQMALSTAGTMDKSALERASAALEAAKAKEAETQSRFGLSSGLAKDVAAQDLQRKALLTTAAGQSAASALDRATQGVNAGLGIDKATLDAYTNAGTLGLSSDAAVRAANEAMIAGGKTQSEMLNAGVGQASDLASRADALETTRASAQASAASLAQAAREGRIDAQLAREAQAVVNAAQSAAGQLSTADAEALANALNEIQTALNMEGVDSATIMAKIQTQKETIANILKGAEIVAGAVKNKATGGAAGAAGAAGTTG